MWHGGLYASKAKLFSEANFFFIISTSQKILTEIRHHFWLKNDGEKWSTKNYFKIPRWPSELLLPSAKKSAQKG